MLKFWSRKKDTPKTPDSPSSLANTNDKTASTKELIWDESARQGLQQALAQAPVPAMLKGKVKKELKNAAEDTARAAGRSTVTAEDLMNGLLGKLPSNMRTQVEDAMKGGPEALKKLQRKLGK